MRRVRSFPHLRKELVIQFEIEQAIERDSANSLTTSTLHADAQPPGEDRTLSSGARLGPYQIVELLGRGGMGEVYRARDTRLGREVAVKVMAPHLSQAELAPSPSIST